MEFTLLGAAAIAVAAFWLMLRWEAKRGNAAGCAVDLWDAGLVSAITGVLVGRLVSMVQAGISPIADPAQIILIRSGVSTTGVVIGTIVVFAFLARRDPVVAADAIAPAALVGLAGWHAGCLVTGSCLGIESSLPWALTLPGSDVTRHPVELYAAVGLLIAGIGLALWKQHGRPPLGSIAGTAVLAASAIRLATEPLRISLAGGPIYLYAAGVVIGAAMIVASFILRSRQPKAESR
jgi:prolipoprotein diacylglyceryltransferase